MVKWTQTIQIADELFECVWPFCGVGAERVKNYLKQINHVVFKQNKTKPW